MELVAYHVKRVEIEDPETRNGSNWRTLRIYSKEGVIEINMFAEEASNLRFIRQRE